MKLILAFATCISLMMPQVFAATLLLPVSVDSETLQHEAGNIRVSKHDLKPTAVMDSRYLIQIKLLDNKGIKLAEQLVKDQWYEKRGSDLKGHGMESDHFHDNSYLIQLPMSSDADSIEVYQLDMQNPLDKQLQFSLRLP